MITLVAAIFRAKRESKRTFGQNDSNIVSHANNLTAFGGGARSIGQIPRQNFGVLLFLENLEGKFGQFRI
jgi:hypothetical protein